MRLRTRFFGTIDHARVIDKTLVCTGPDGQLMFIVANHGVHFICGTIASAFFTITCTAFFERLNAAAIKTSLSISTAAGFGADASIHTGMIGFGQFRFAFVIATFFDRRLAGSRFTDLVLTAWPLDIQTTGTDFDR